jgi:hypothetical protein
MSRTLKVELAVPNALSVQGMVHNFHNFGEDVYRALQNECEVSIEEIDHSVSAFHLRGLKKRDVRSIAARVRKILEKHSSLRDIKIYEIPEDPDS